MKDDREPKAQSPIASRPIDLSVPQEVKWVLVVEDEIPLRELFRQLLRSHPVKASLVAYAFEALEQIAQRRFDLALIDVRLPDKDGLELLREALKIQPDLKVIIMTGHGDSHLATTAMKFGAIEHLQKPFDLKRVQGLLQEHLLGQPVKPVSDTPAWEKNEFVLAAGQENQRL